MTWNDIVSIVLTLITAVGGAGVIIVVLSGWLGKLWAEKLMNADKAKHDADLAQIRSQLDRDNQAEIEHIKANLGLLKDHHLKDLSDKIAIYRQFVDLIADVLASFEKAMTTGGALNPDQIALFNAQRLRLYGYMALTSPQSVMDAQDRLIDYLLKVVLGHQQYDWILVRQHALSLVNECRKDIGFNTSSIQYNGEL